MIDICVKYSNAWRFKFGINTTKCLTIGNNVFLCEPHWSLGHVTIENTDILNILGTVFSNDGKSVKHVDSRILKCRQSYYGLSCIGMPYPGLPVDLKCHIWQTICRPILTFGLETMFLSKTMLSRLNSLQGSIIKNFLALSKQSRHSKLLQALNISSIETTVKRQSLSLLKKKKLCKISCA